MKLVPVSCRINSVHSLAPYFLRSILMLSPFYNLIFRVVFFLHFSIKIPYALIFCLLHTVYHAIRVLLFLLWYFVFDEL